MAKNDTNTNDAPQTSEGDVNTATGPVTAGEGLAQSEVPAPVDMSNTYENGVPGAPINTAVPEGAHLVTDLNEALDVGYFGYARGEANTESFTLAEAGKRNARLREARQGSVNQSAAAEDGKTK